jgi:hypothetical protein
VFAIESRRRSERSAAKWVFQTFERCSMFKKFGSSIFFFWVLFCLAAGAAALVAVSPAAAQVSLYHMDFKPADFNSTSPGLAAGEVNIGPTNFAMPGFGWDETHGQQARPGVFYPAVVGSNPEDPGNRAFLFLFGAAGQTNSSFTSIDMENTDLAPVKIPAGGIDPTLPANAGLGISWSQHLENTASGNPVHVRVAVQIASGNWYASNAVFDTGTVGAGSQGNFDAQQLIYSAVKTNWLNLTIGAAAADGVTLGAAPASNLTGNITGVGFIGSFIQQSTVHIDFVDIGIPPVPGDANGDRLVTTADYNIIKANFGKSVAGRPQGDLNGDGLDNLLDFAQWKTAFTGSGSGSFSVGEVPEPASAVLMLLAAPFVWGMFRCRKVR